ncbi:hypothetical protein AAA434_12700 [Lactobacillus crispatus]|uniref:hypothetical protein n=1 Tax=Lactobacillus crispatus TaxID=47770 RepID=UPI0030FC4F85
MIKYIATSFDEYSQKKQYTYKQETRETVYNIFTSKENEYLQAKVTGYPLVHGYNDISDMGTTVLNAESELNEYFYKKVTKLDNYRTDLDRSQLLNVASVALEHLVDKKKLKIKNNLLFSIHFTMFGKFLPIIKATCLGSVKRLFERLDQFFNYLQEIIKAVVKEGKSMIDEMVDNKHLIKQDPKFWKEHFIEVQIRNVKRVYFDKPFLSLLQMGIGVEYAVIIYFLLVTLGVQIWRDGSLLLTSIFNK